MSRTFINLIDVAAAGTCFYFLHRSGHAVPSDEIQRRLYTRLNSVSTPAEMHTASADLARMVALRNRAVDKFVEFANELIGFSLLSGVANVVLILLGTRTGMLRHKSSNQSLEPTAGRLENYKGEIRK
jgi:hypothetical protein